MGLCEIFEVGRAGNLRGRRSEMYVPVLILSVVVQSLDSEMRGGALCQVPHTSSFNFSWRCPGNGLKEQAPQAPRSPSGTEQGAEGVSKCTEVTLGSWAHTEIAGSFCCFSVSGPDTMWDNPQSSLLPSPASRVALPVLRKQAESRDTTLKEGWPP